MDEQSFTRLLNQLSFSETDQLRLYHNEAIRGPNKSASDSRLSVDEIRQRGRQYVRRGFCDTAVSVSMLSVCRNTCSAIRPRERRPILPPFYCKMRAVRHGWRKELIVNRIGAGNGKHDTFSVTRDLFAELLQTCRLPTEFLQSIYSNNGSLGHFVDYSGRKPSSLCESPVIMNSV